MQRYFDISDYNSYKLPNQFQKLIEEGLVCEEDQEKGNALCGILKEIWVNFRSGGDHNGDALVPEKIREKLEEISSFFAFYGLYLTSFVEIEGEDSSIHLSQN